MWEGWLFRGKLFRVVVLDKTLWGACAERKFMRESCLGNSCPGCNIQGKLVRGAISPGDKSPRKNYLWEIL